MLNFQPDQPTASAYDDDFVLWLDAQVELLRAGRYELLDKDNLLDELNAMTRHERRSLRSRLEKIVMHMLKIDFQPARRTRSWSSSIREQRRQIAFLLEDSPSLQHELRTSMDGAYQAAVYEAAKQTGLPASAFPPACPYSLDQILHGEAWA
ncbi:DUF29 domain-containing protein [Pseudoduganella aquatica]|uniref:DUF29 family protein n=1 Tax=Pseudoduganella aquatica TaxID=2660641 RepID=A0A7X4HC04_9BURK|nr:DUF29 domain-containing protein [Pseudoduganella aquatica]MYN08370.1 DUF29 family protein [Pseudoduganella aquatica]